MNWAGRPPNACNNLMGLSLAVALCLPEGHAGAKQSRTHSAPLQLFMSCPTLPSNEYKFSVQGCEKQLQQCHGLPKGNLFILKHQGSREKGEARWPGTYLGRIGSKLLPWKYSSACPPFSSCKTGLPSPDPAHCWHSYMACETPNMFSAQHHAMVCSCVYRSQFPLQPVTC